MFLRSMVLLLMSLSVGLGGQAAATGPHHSAGAVSPACEGGERWVLRFQLLSGRVLRPQTVSGSPRRLQLRSVARAGVLAMVQEEPEPTDSPIRDALRDGKYPWYDSRSDRVQPVWPVRISWLERLAERIRSFLIRIGKFFDRFDFGGRGGASIAGNSIGTILLMAALAAFFLLIFLLWVRREAGPGRVEAARATLGTAARLGDLPEGIRPADADPWAEANRRRAAGDLAGAVVCLFAHQLLTLDQSGLIRLAPGRTGRHDVQSLRDRELIDCLGATLGLFEDVYYGRRLPNAQAFELVWTRAKWFQERQRTLGTGLSP
jgi:hypothetical protein